MARKKRVETQAERTHGHCADVLMSDFGIPKDMRDEVCQQIGRVWVQNTMIHCLIISSIRNYQPHAATRGLEAFLQRHATQEQKHRKPEQRMSSQGHFDSRGHYHRHD